MEVPSSHALRPEELVGTMLHIFYANKFVGKDIEDPGIDRPSDWPILFQGELSSDSTSHTVQSRSTTLTFVGHSRWFDQTQLIHWDPDRESQDPIFGRETQVETLFFGNTSWKIDSESLGPLGTKKGQFLTLLQRRFQTLQGDEQRFIAYQALVLSVLRQSKDLHPMLGLIDRKLKLSQRFGAYVDKDVTKLLTLEQMATLWDNRYSALPSNATLMHLLNIGNDLLKYDFKHLTQPRLRRSEFQQTENEKLRAGLNEVEEEEAKLEAAVEKIAEFIAVQSPQGGVVSTEVGTITFPPNYDVSAAKAVTVSTFVKRITKYMADRADARDSSASAAAAFQALMFTKPTKLYPSKGLGQSTLNDTEIKPEPNQSEVPPDQTRPTQSGQGNQDSPEKRANDEALIAAEQQFLRSRDEINEFVVTPNLEFAAPPRCNVILPPNISQYGMVRNHLQEPTRLLTKATIIPKQVIQYYMAPWSVPWYRVDAEGLATFSPRYDEFNQTFGSQFKLEEEPSSEDTSEGDAVAEGGTQNMTSLDAPPGRVSTEISIGRRSERGPGGATK
jgi:hypothetical protein